MAEQGIIQGQAWPTIGGHPERPDDPRAQDVEFEMELLTPDQIRRHPKYRDRLNVMLDASLTTHYAALTADTRYGPFVTIIPINGRVAMLTKGLTEYLVRIAQEELARSWAEMPEAA